jgi:hypothetical protein
MSDLAGRSFSGDGPDFALSADFLAAASLKLEFLHPLRVDAETFEVVILKARVRREASEPRRIRAVFVGYLLPVGARHCLALFRRGDAVAAGDAVRRPYKKRTQRIKPPLDNTTRLLQ